MKLITSIAAASVLLFELCTYAMPGLAQPADIERFNELVLKGRELHPGDRISTNELTTEKCEVKLEISEILAKMTAKGRWIRFGKNDGGAQHRKYEKDAGIIVGACISKGLLPSSSSKVSPAISIPQRKNIATTKRQKNKNPIEGFNTFYNTLCDELAPEARANAKILLGIDCSKSGLAIQGTPDYMKERLADPRNAACIERGYTGWDGGKCYSNRGKWVEGTKFNRAKPR